MILDSRVVTKRYGRMFLDALPDCRRVYASGRVESDACSTPAGGVGSIIRDIQTDRKPCDGKNAQ